MIRNALSIDVEEYYHGMEFASAIPVGKHAYLPSRVELNVDRVLELLATYGVQATFFCVGQVAKAHPSMMRKIVNQGHEVACHSDRHELVWRQTPDEFRNDLQWARARLEDLTGQPVLGYRAPNYSIGREQAWAYDILLTEGFKYDSSVYPIVHDRYGQADAPRFPYEIHRCGPDALIEFPIATRRLFGVNFPLGGGGFFRLLPTVWFRQGIRHLNHTEGQAAMFYFHPWELDPRQPYPRMPWRHRFRHYINLEQMEAKLHRLLRDIPFAPVSEVLGLTQISPALTARTNGQGGCSVIRT